MSIATFDINVSNSSGNVETGVLEYANLKGFAFQLPYLLPNVLLCLGLLDQKKRPLSWKILGNDKIGDRCKTSS